MYSNAIKGTWNNFSRLRIVLHNKLLFYGNYYSLEILFRHCLSGLLFLSLLPLLPSYPLTYLLLLLVFLLC